MILRNVSALIVAMLSSSSYLEAEAFVFHQPSRQTRYSVPFKAPSLPERKSILLSSSVENEEFSSVAKEWADDNLYNTSEKKKKKYVVVGGGWGGWGAAKTLCQSGIDDMEVILIDALPDPTGATPYLSPTGKPVEAGTRGFWKDYPNIEALCSELNLEQNEIFTPFTNSSFYSPDGLEATSPVFSESNPFTYINNPNNNLPFLSNLQSSKFPTLPSPLGQVLATFPLFERIPLPDRASMLGLLLATVDCLGSTSESTRAAYDRMTAHDLFIKFNLSPRLVRDFINPTLLVGLFKPAEELSALVVMELLYYYALAHQDSFDVRWIKNGTVADSLIQPLADVLIEEDGLEVKGGCFVGDIRLKDSNTNNNQKTATELDYYDTQKGQSGTITDIDGIILALGCKGTKSVVGASPDLARIPTFSKAASLNGIDVISCRLWFDEVVPTRTPANVFSRFECLRGAGGTFFMLDQLQGNNEAQLWGEAEDDDQGGKRGSVVACDFYNAGALMSLADEDLIKILTDELLPSAVPKFGNVKLLDSWVGRYPGTVSWFSPGSYLKRPPLEGADTLPNVKFAGDWVRMGEREHGAKGLCQERAYVSGIEAANSLLRSTGRDGFVQGEVIPVRDDEEQFKLAVEVNRKVMSVFPRFWVR